MVDNFDAVRDYVADVFARGDVMFFVQIFQRRKDLPDLNTHCKKVRSYHIHNLEEFDTCRKSIVEECTLKHARAYFDVNAKDVRKVALLALKMTAEHIYNGQHQSVKNVYDSACGNVACIGRKLWLVDIDVRDPDVVEEVCARLQGLGSEVMLRVPSKNGHHLLTSPFPLGKGACPTAMDNVDIIKHGVMLLYT